MKNFILSRSIKQAACLGFLLFSQSAVAGQEMGSLYYYPVTQAEIQDNEHIWRVFLEYNLKREQCQHYQPLPPGFVMRDCDIYRIEAATQALPQRTPVSTMSSYTIYFDHDKAGIRADQKHKIAEVMNYIQQYQPDEVHISGHAGRSGSVGHNMTLSEERAETVKDALVMRGVEADTIYKRAYGETNLAVQTADGVRMPENRRVVISFEHDDQ